MLSAVLEKHLNQIRQQETPTVPATPAAVEFAAPKVGPNAPTDKQINFYKSLVEKKQLTVDQRNALKQSLGFADRRTISSAIQYLTTLPWEPRPAPVQKQVNTYPGAKLQEGYYAVVDPVDGILKFYRIRKPKQGKWAGWTFISHVSGDNQLPMRDRVERDRIFAEIAKNPVEALKRFGQKIGQCGHCRKQLTDEVSREFGIGPVCRKVLGL